MRASEVRADILKELIRAKSIVGAQLGLFWKDSLWEQLNAKGKYENTVSAIKTFFLAHSLRQPVVIELEDGQWLDSDSLGVVQAFTHNITSYPLLILSTLRYAEDGSKPSLLNSQDVTERKIPYEEIELHEFSETDLRNFAEVSLGAPIDEPFYSVLAEKTDGNPLFGEQLLHYFRENECVERKDGTWQLKSADIHIPDTINVILMARIDRLPGEVKEMVKTAAVIGREFNVLLLSEMLQRDVFSEVKFVQKSRIWQELQNMSFMFTHVLLRDIAYEMQLTSRRRELHQRAAEVMEKLYASHLTEWYAALAFHYEKAEITNKTIEYLEKAADEAKAQYHNRQALEFYDRLLFYLQDMFGFSDLELETLLKKAEILELTGEWNECQRVCQQAFEFAEELDDICRMGKTNLLLGRISRQTGQYDRAIELFEQAKTRFEDVEDNEGVSRVLTNMGHVNRVKSDSGMALMYYEKALKMSEELGDTFGKARNANNIGIVYTELTINYEMAMMWYNKSLPLYKRIGEKQGEGVVLNNIGECHRLQGQYDLAMTCYGQALAIYEELGAKLDIAITLGNMGHVYQAKSDYERAIVHYDKAITLLKELGDKYFLSEYTLGKAEALFSLQHYEEAQTLNAEIQPITEEFGMKEDLLKSKVLAVKLDRVLGNTEALHGLYEMLQQTQDETELALLHYELWKMTQHNDHRRQALTLYQTLYENTPNIVYKKRKEELQDLSMSNEE
ncbi:MAG: tetratricopeptide repeat protein [bacterium]|nr:tetratricopeptide repeat protein [bacterium]